VKSGFQKANNLAFCRLNTPSSARGTETDNANNLALSGLNGPELCEGHEGSQTRLPSRKTGAFLFIVILAMKYLESSTVKSGFQKANSLALSGLNALSSAKGMKAPKLASPVERLGLFYLWS
jgi:hypothetical protein